MTNESFEKGFAALVATFPSMNFNAKLYWEMLHDLDGECFLRAVWDFIKQTKEVFPGTNIIALLRDRAVGLRVSLYHDKQLRIEQETEQKRIERWKKESAPMPEDCRVALAKLGVRLP